MLSVPLPAAVQFAVLALHTARPSKPAKFVASLLNTLTNTAVDAPLQPVMMRLRSIVLSLIVTENESPDSIFPTVPPLTLVVENAVGLGLVVSMVTVQLVVAALPAASVA